VLLVSTGHPSRAAAAAAEEEEEAGI